jgi:macrolide-specific efflux system membrane fusion protein
MTKKSKFKIFIGVALVIAAAVFLFNTKSKPTKETTREVELVTGDIRVTITSTAIVQPQSRLEIKPPINGRIDEILIKEGDKVALGQTLAWMSSTERAALLDAARARGPEEVKYWADVYKPTPLVSPIDGEVIVSTDKPGQTITASDVVVVLSDKLIVQAQIDETDIGKVMIGQEADISLDAYPDIRVKGMVSHIYYESKTVNNVTIYQVDVLPDTTPIVFRSGMTATVSIVEKTREGALLLPLEAVKRGKDGDYVLFCREPGAKPEERVVEIGLSDEKNVEIVSGLSEGDKVICVSEKFALSGAQKPGTNPFMPSMRRGGR